MSSPAPTRRRLLSGAATALLAATGGTVTSQLLLPEEALAGPRSRRRRRRLAALRRRRRLAARRRAAAARARAAAQASPVPSPTPTVPGPTPATPTPPSPTTPAPTVPASPPSTTELHYLNRLGCGFSPETFAQLAAAGGAQAWLTSQLDPASVARVGRRDARCPGTSPTWTTRRQPSGRPTPAARRAAGSTPPTSRATRCCARSTRAGRCSRTWSASGPTTCTCNANHDSAWLYRKSYDDTIRAHALGTFEDLLVACSLHPAMLLYLDNWTSVRNAPNENQGRELLELHTVGRGAGYTEQMVKDSAKLLSGYTVDAWKTWAPSYDSKRHTTGAVQVLGFSDANAAADGSALTVGYLRYLAHHPATATRIATKLCRHFVADAPSDAIVAAVAKAFTDSGTDITTTLRALVAHPDFLAGRGLLVRNPVEDFVATCRVLRRPGAAAHRRPVVRPRLHLGAPRPRCSTSGRARTVSRCGDAAWSSATRMLNSFRMHWNLAAGWWPTKDVTLPQQRRRLAADDQPPARRVRRPPLALRARQGRRRPHGRRRRRRHGLPGEHRPDRASHQVVGWMHVRVMGVLLDSPDHMRR